VAYNPPKAHLAAKKTILARVGFDAKKGWSANAAK